ncbi:MAG: hypothetical protein WCI05_17485 [Myxococcales bacterium]|jgi:hypothetical protein
MMGSSGVVARGAFVVMVLTLAAACAELRRSLGEECLKDDDCLSGICSQLQCVAAPPMLDGSLPFREAGLDAGTDVVMSDATGE